MNILSNNFVQMFGLVSLNQLSIMHEMKNIKLFVPLFKQRSISVFIAAKVYLHAYLYLASD